MKLNQLEEAIPAGASFTREKTGIIVVHRLKDGKVEPDVAAYKHKVNGIVIQGLGLTSLEGLPKIIYGNLLVDSNNLTSLAGGPEEVHGLLDISKNPISSLEGMPSKISSLTAIKTNLTSLHNIHKHIKQFVPHSQTNGTIKYAHTNHSVSIAGSITMGNREIKSHILGCLMIPGFSGISICYDASGPFYEAMVTINRAIKDNTPLTGPEILAVQDDMLDKNLDDWAQL